MTPLLTPNDRRSYSLAAGLTQTPVQALLRPSSAP